MEISHEPMAVVVRAPGTGGRRSRDGLPLSRGAVALGRAIARRRLTLRAFASAAGVHPSLVSRSLRGETLPDLPAACAYERVTRIPPRWWLEPAAGVVVPRPAGAP